MPSEFHVTYVKHIGLSYYLCFIERYCHFFLTETAPGTEGFRRRSLFQVSELRKKNVGKIETLETWKSWRNTSNIYIYVYNWRQFPGFLGLLWVTFLFIRDAFSTDRWCQWSRPSWKPWRLRLGCQEVKDLVVKLQQSMQDFLSSNAAKQELSSSESKRALLMFGYFDILWLPRPEVVVPLVSINMGVLPHRFGTFTIAFTI